MSTVFLKSKGFTVPLSSPYPEPIKDASKNVAAWLFRARDAPPNENQVLFNIAMKFLEAYIEGEAENELPTYESCGKCASK